MPAAYAIPNLSKVLRLNARAKARTGGGARIHRVNPQLIGVGRQLNRGFIRDEFIRLNRGKPVIWDPLGARVVRRTLTGGGIVRAQRNLRRLAGL